MGKQNKDNLNNNSIRKNITITEEQEEYVKEKCINLSRFVQKKLNEVIKKK